MVLHILKAMLFRPLAYTLLRIVFRKAHELPKICHHLNFKALMTNIQTDLGLLTCTG